MKAKTITQQLKEAIENARVTRRTISQQTSVSESILSRFMAGKTSMEVATVDKLAGFLGLRLVVKGKASKGKAGTV